MRLPTGEKWPVLKAQTKHISTSSILSEYTLLFRASVQVLYPQYTLTSVNRITMLMATRKRDGRRKKRLMAVTLSLLLIGAHYELCAGFALRSLPVVLGVRRQSEALCSRCQSSAVRGRLSAVPNNREDHGSVVTEPPAEPPSLKPAKERRKVVKPWFTRAQETVDYSNVEAMYVDSFRFVV